MYNDNIKDNDFLKNLRKAIRKEPIDKKKKKDTKTIKFDFCKR